MAAVAEGHLAAALARAEEYLAAGLRLELKRRERRALVGTVAERLRLRASASAPPVTLAGFHFNGKGRFLGDNGLLV